jgi:hypothetical protein
MAKKDLANVTADLSALASMMPTQRPAVAPIAAEPPVLKVVATPKPSPAAKAEPLTQFSLSLRKDLRKQLSRLADDADMTMRAFVLNALKAKGLDVRADDLLDLRKERR